MKLRESLALKLCLFLVAAAPAATPGTAPVLSANPSAVDFEYSSNEPAPQPVFVTVTASDASTPVIAVTVTPGTNTPAALFPQPPVNGLTFQVGIDINTLNSLLSQPGTYTATITVTAAGFAPLSVPVTLGVNTQLSLAASPSSLTFNPPVSPTVQTVSLTGPSVSFGLTVATATGANWLAASSSETFTPATLTITVNPLNLGAGTYTGTVTVNPSVGTALAIPVTLQMGANTLSASPTSFGFTYTLGGTTPPPQVLQLSSTLSNNTYVAQATSSGNWLLVNGVTANVSGALPASLNVTINPAGLTAATYTGTISVTDAHGSVQNIGVTLVVSGIGSVANPSSLTFVAQVGGAAPAPQTLSVGEFANVTFTATTNQTWLSVSPASGPTPAQITVTANPAGMVASTYTGNIEVGVSAHPQTIPVTFVVSANPVLTTDIGEITYNYLGGNPSPAPFTVNVNVSSGSPQQFSFVTAVPSWLQLSLTSTTTPAALSVSLAPQSLPNGTYVADIILIPSGTGGVPVTVPVLLEVAGAPPVVPSPTSFTFTAAAGGAPQNQSLLVTAAAATVFTAAASTTTGGPWLSVSPTSGTASTAPTSLTVTADATNLAQGTYLGAITLTSSIGVVTAVPVTFSVGPPGVALTIAPTTLAFSYTQNGALPAAQSVQITGSQKFTANTATNGGGPWLSVTPTSGAGNTTLSVMVNPAGLASGSYSGTITVTPAGGTAQTVTVTLTVTTGTLTATPGSLAFSYTTNNPTPVTQTLTVTATGGPVTFTSSVASSGWLSVTPTFGTTPATLTVAVNPASLSAGSYSGSIAVIGGSGAAVNIAVTLTVFPAALPLIDRVVNSASYAGGGISPGEIVVVFGSALGPATGVIAAIDSKGYIESSLANVQVTFNGYAAPILYASAAQINAIVPYELAGQSNASVEVMFGSARSNSLTLPVVSSAPGIYSADQSGTGPGAILDVNYHLVTASNPASAGDIVQVFATGQGQTSPAGVDGLIEPLTPPWPTVLLAPAATVGGMPANIQYIGAAPGLVAGALQVNVVIPAGLAPGPAALVIYVGVNGSQNGLTVALQ